MIPHRRNEKDGDFGSSVLGHLLGLSGRVVLHGRNPAGRPRGTREFAELIAQETRGCAELTRCGLITFSGVHQARVTNRSAFDRLAIGA